MPGFSSTADGLSSGSLGYPQAARWSEKGIRCVAARYCFGTKKTQRFGDVFNTTPLHLNWSLHALFPEAKRATALSWEQPGVQVHGLAHVVRQLRPACQTCFEGDFIVGTSLGSVQEHGCKAFFSTPSSSHPTRTRRQERTPNPRSPAEAPVGRFPSLPALPLSVIQPRCLGLAAPVSP